MSIAFLFHLSRCDVALNGYCMYKIINYVVLDRQGNHGIGLVTDLPFTRSALSSGVCVNGLSNYRIGPTASRHIDIPHRT